MKPDDVIMTFGKWEKTESKIKHLEDSLEKLKSGICEINITNHNTYDYGPGSSDRFTTTDVIIINTKQELKEFTNRIENSEQLKKEAEVKIKEEEARIRSKWKEYQDMETEHHDKLKKTEKRDAYIKRFKESWTYKLVKILWGEL